MSHRRFIPADRSRSNRTRRRARRRICESKQRFRTEEDALDVLVCIPDGNELRAYRCPICNKWHLGHEMKPLIRADYFGDS